jgi:transglutaminase-like putative cysteine protease
MDLTPYHCKGFGPFWDDALVNPTVTGIDADHCRGTIRVCDETERELYYGDYSPRRIRYRPGSRPGLEKISSQWKHLSDRDKTAAAMAWTQKHLPHRNHHSDIRGDRGMTEEQLLASGVGYCNEQARVVIALCATMNIPGRMCFLFHKSLQAGHACCELFIENKWVFHDISFGVRVQLPDGTLASGADLRGQHRRLTLPAYAGPAKWFKENSQPFAVTGERDDPKQFDKFFHDIGVSNYVVDGVDVLERATS